MSLVVTVYVREGIVMAADSRLTLNRQEKKNESAVVNLLAVGQSDSNYKLFLAPSGIGIAAYGAADIQGVPIAGYVESLIAPRGGESDDSVKSVAEKLLEHFAAYSPVPKTYFHVAGYTSLEGVPEQEVWVVDIGAHKLAKINPEGKQGASWGGEADIVSRLLQPVALVDTEGELQSKLPLHQIPWRFFTLQDAIDFAVFAIRSTIEAMRFQPRAKTVGGPIDVLVIKPGDARWIHRKELRVDG